jgi:hypothetical protein
MCYVNNNLPSIRTSSKWSVSNRISWLMFCMYLLSLFGLLELYKSFLFVLDFRVWRRRQWKVWSRGVTTQKAANLTVRGARISNSKPYSFASADSWVHLELHSITTRRPQSSLYFNYNRQDLCLLLEMIFQVLIKFYQLSNLHIDHWRCKLKRFDLINNKITFCTAIIKYRVKYMHEFLNGNVPYETPQ